jgi:hypothetical protein
MADKEGKMDSDAGRFAAAIAVFFLAMIAFFFAFHPGGVEGVSNPTQILQWLFGAVNNVTGASTQLDASTEATNINTAALNYPGYTSAGTSDIGTAGASNIQVT